LLYDFALVAILMVDAERTQCNNGYSVSAASGLVKERPRVIKSSGT
jgi:hypothetical protein